MAGAKKEKKHIVVFQDEEGNVLKTSFVSHEEAALPPEMPEKRGESVHHEIKSVSYTHLLKINKRGG